MSHLTSGWTLDSDNESIRGVIAIRLAARAQWQRLWVVQL